MTGPVDGAIDARVEWFYDGDWQDVSDDVDMRSEITVTYGQPDEHGETESTDINMLMRNENAQCAPEDPTGERFGKIGRGTLMRVRIGDPQPVGELALPALEGAYASTPDTAALDITGDIDIRLGIEPATWRPGLLNVLAAKYFSTDGNRSWVVYRLADGTLRLRWSSDGITTTTVSSTEVVPADAGRIVVRVTLDVDNGAAGNDVTFYIADTIAGPWTQLGTTVTTAGTTSLASTSQEVTIGAGSGGDVVFSDGERYSGAMFAFELRSGIGGTVVTDPDFTVLDADTTSFTDAAGRTWTLQGDAAIVVRDPSIRGSVTAVSWVPTWDETGYDARMAVRGAGILERLGHGREPLRSPLVYDLSTAATTVAYWPMEDGASASSVAAAVGGQPLSVSGDVTMASYDGFAGSGPVPTFGTGGHVVGSVPAYVPDVRQRLACMLHQAESPTGDRNLLVANCSGGTLTEAILVLKADGSLRIVLRDGVGANVLDFAGGVGDLRDENAMVWMLLTQDGADIDWQFGKIAEGEDFVTLVSGALAGYTYGRFTAINVGSDGDLAGTAVGHVHVVNGDDSEGLWTTAFNSLIAWAGERAGDRIRRLCGQESVPVLIDGATAETEQVGVQGIDQLLTSLDGAAAVDGGPWGERRDTYSLLYRTRASLYRQNPALTLDMDDGTITTSLSPPLDTQSVRNDVTVTRDGGSSYRAIQLAGPLSVQDPPDGIGGSYPTSPQLNLYSDSQVADQATWRLHLGTADGHRISRLEIEMHHHPDLVQAVLELRNGDLVRILNTPTGLPPGPLDLIVLGTADSITDQTWHVTLNCAPGKPWQVGVVSNGSDEERVDTDGSVLDAEFVAGTDTTMRVVSTLGPKWTEDPAEFPFELQVSGAAITATGAVTAELAPNPTFETNVAGWQPEGGTFTHSTTQAHSGTGSGLQTPDGATAVVRARNTIPIEVRATREYTFTAWVFSANGYDVDTSVLFRDEFGGTVEFAIWASESVAAGIWTELTATRSAPDGAVDAQLNINQRTTPAVTDLLYVDDVSFTGPVQTITVDQQPVNGIAKTIPAGADVRLRYPMIIAL